MFIVLINTKSVTTILYGRTFIGCAVYAQYRYGWTEFLSAKILDKNQHFTITRETTALADSFRQELF